MAKLIGRKDLVLDDAPHRRPERNFIATLPKESLTAKIFRFLVYVAAIAGTLIGVALLRESELSISYADGTHIVKLSYAIPLFAFSIIALTLNIIWGIARWCSRSFRERWRLATYFRKLILGGLWRVLLIVPFSLLVIYYVTPFLSRQIADTVLEARTDLAPFDPDLAYHRLAYLSEHFSSLDAESVAKELTKLTLSNVDYDVPAASVSPSAPVDTESPAPDSDAASTENTSTEDTPTENTPAESTPVESTATEPTTEVDPSRNSITKYLNRTYLSSGTHFLIIYSDTGDDQITELQASVLAEMLEGVITGFSQYTELIYEYTPTINNEASLARLSALLQKNGLDPAVLNRAMPVFVTNPFDTTTTEYITYAGQAYQSLASSLAASLDVAIDSTRVQSYASTPLYPFINIRPKIIASDSLPILAAHELAHHYIDNYCKIQEDKSCTNNEFATESLANWLAVTALPDTASTTVINYNHYNSTYLAKGTDYSIDSSIPGFTGYPAIAFLENYTSLKENGASHLFTALTEPDPLAYLYGTVTPDVFRSLMTIQAEKNLTGSYGGVLTNYILPTGHAISCPDICRTFHQIAPASTEYYYFSTAEYVGSDVVFTGTENAHTSILMRDYDGNWEYFASNAENIPIGITDRILKKYQFIVFAVNNSSITDNETVAFDRAKTDLADYIDFDTRFTDISQSSNAFRSVGQDCYEVDTDQLLGGLGSILNPSTENDTYAYTVRTCTNNIKSLVGFDDLKSAIASSLGFYLNPGNSDDGTTKSSTFVVPDLLNHRFVVYFLKQDVRGTYLQTFSLDPFSHSVL